MPIEPGIINEQTVTVTPEMTASGTDRMAPVLSTPRLIGFMEQTCHYAILPLLQEGQSSVGTLVNVRHLAATPVGMQVRFRAELLEVDGRRPRSAHKACLQEAGACVLPHCCRLPWDPDCHK